MVKTLEESKRILQHNFETFREAYRKKHDADFLGSDDLTMFFRNTDDLEKIIRLNQDAKKREQLIDLTNFYELCLGNPEKADVIILGKNPGAEGLDNCKTADDMKRLLDELELRKEKRSCFFPLASFEAMVLRPWFPNRLIFGHIRRENRKEILAPESDLKEGILSRFITVRKDACRYAERICSLDIVPYHTSDFTFGKQLVREFGIDDILAQYLRNAMKNGKIILAPYSSTFDIWNRFLKKKDGWKDFKDYEYSYTTHLRYGQKNAAQDGNMNIAALRHYSKINTPRTADENCDAIFNRLEELGWERI